MKIKSIQKRQGNFKVYCLNIPETHEMILKNGVIIGNCLYGSTEFGLQSNLGVDIETAKVFLNVFYETYPEFKKYMDDFRDDAKKFGWVKTLTGKKRRLPELTYIGRDGNNKDRRKRLNSMMNGAINAPIQGSSGQTCLLAMCAIREELKNRNFVSRILSNVHDSILVETHVDELDEVVEILKDCMSRKYYENRLGCKVKLKAEVKYGEVWGFGKKEAYWKQNPKEFQEMIQRINERNDRLWGRYPCS